MMSMIRENKADGNDKNNQGLTQIAHVLHDVCNHISSVSKSNHGISGITTGFSNLDKYISGLNENDLLLLTSRPGVGKTGFILSVALHVAKNHNCSVAIFSPRTSAEILVMRMLSSESDVAFQRLTRGRLTKDEWTHISDAATTLSRAKIEIDDSVFTNIDDIINQSKKMSNLGLIIFEDALNLQSGFDVHIKGKKAKYKTNFNFSSGIQVIAEELNVPIICTTYLPRRCDARQNKRPLISDLIDIEPIVEKSDIILALYREKYYSLEASNLSECIILKNRWGEVGMVELRWNPRYLSFSD